MDSQDFSKLYQTDDQHIMKTAEDSLNPRVDRVEELKAYAKKAGVKTIGIANCITFNKEADILEEELKAEGFTVAKVHCKYGKVPFNDIVEGYKGVSCNPAGQAKYLEDKGTELNIMMGLCVGHDMIFNSKSKAPVSPLVVKDRKLKNHSLSRFNKDIKN